METLPASRSIDTLIQGLRDIDLPAGISFWPPAPGWWILSIILLSILSAVIFGWYNKRALRRAALRELARLQQDFPHRRSDEDLTRALSLLLRRLSLAVYPRNQVAGLHGEAWLHHLDRTTGTTAFSRGPGQVLLTLPYGAKGEADIPQLLMLVGFWIRRNT